MNFGWAAAGGISAAVGLWLLCRRGVALPIIVIGDSIAVGIGESLGRLEPRSATAAQVGEGVEGTAARLQERLSDSAARTVVLSTGVNSLEQMGAAEVMRQTLEIVAAIRVSGRKVVLIGPPPAFGAAGVSNEWRAELASLERLHARMRGRVSLWQLLGDSNRVGYFDSRWGGGLHPNSQGYERVARAILGK